MTDDDHDTSWLPTAIIIGSAIGIILAAVYLRVVHGSWVP